MRWGGFDKILPKFYHHQVICKLLPWGREDHGKWNTQYSEVEYNHLTSTAQQRQSFHHFNPRKCAHNSDQPT